VVENYNGLERKCDGYEHKGTESDSDFSTKKCGIGWQVSATPEEGKVLIISIWLEECVGRDSGEIPIRSLNNNYNKTTNLWNHK
jgi:hypothetical protein